MRAANGNGIGWIRAEKRLAIYLRDGLACCYCGHAVEDGAQLSLDHLTPRSKGGSNEATNLVTCCLRCNSSRGNRSVRSFCRVVAAYVNHGLTADVVERTVRNAAARKLDVPAAKALIAKRGTPAKVMAAQIEEHSA